MTNTVTVTKVSKYDVIFVNGDKVEVVFCNLIAGRYYMQYKSRVTGVTYQSNFAEDKTFEVYPWHN